MKSQLLIKYEDIISLENLFTAWQEFSAGKKKKPDVKGFGTLLTNNILQLHDELANFTYVHGNYEAFNISDPKPRNIHKATVRDRVLHHAIYRKLYPFFDRVFISNSYSCRNDKGTHKAINCFSKFCLLVGKNNTKTVWILKCDIRKFFASIDHAILGEILRRHIKDSGILWLINQVVKSFHTTREGVGLPLGNLTSQLFVNIYMHEFDMFMKQELREKYYIRYADDFVVLSDNKIHLETILPLMEKFLSEKLKLSLHEHKVYIKAYSSGVDFLGWVHFPHHRQIRTATKRKLVRKLSGYPKPETISSYRGLLGHGNTYKVKKYIWVKNSIDIVTNMLPTSEP
jgi:retron-type reverse transcriptase